MSMGFPSTRNVNEMTAEEQAAYLGCGLALQQVRARNQADQQFVAQYMQGGSIGR